MSAGAPKQPTKAALSLGPVASSRAEPVLVFETSAITGAGVSEALSALQDAVRG